MIAGQQAQSSELEAPMSSGKRALIPKDDALAVAKKALKRRSLAMATRSLMRTRH
jgi:hypothetical protein